MSLVNLFIRWPLPLVLCLAAGCGDSRGLVPVHGRVTFGGGDPPVPGVLFLVPEGPPATGKDTPTTPRAGSATFGPDGRFRVTTFRDGDGLRPGVYEVRVECATPPANVDVNPAGWVDHVPKGFTAPRLDVPANRRQPVIYDLDVPAATR